MLKIQNKTYLTDSEVNKYIAFLMKFPTYICIPYKPYKGLLKEYTLQEYRHDQFNIININKTVSYIKYERKIRKHFSSCFSS